MVFDVVLDAVSTDADYDATLYLKCEKIEYSIDRRIKVYELPIIKSISQLAGGKAWSNIITDWGQSVEDFTLSGAINEGSKYLSLQKMMEYSYFCRIQAFNCAHLYLYIGADPSDPTNLTKYAVMEDGSRILGDDTKGIECKLNKLQFEHKGNTAYIPWSMQIIAAMDFEVTT